MSVWRVKLMQLRNPARDEPFIPTSGVACLPSPLPVDPNTRESSEAMCWRQSPCFGEASDVIAPGLVNVYITHR